MSRVPRPDDLHQLRVPLDAMPSPDGRRICLTVKEAAPDRDGHRTSLWLVPTDGSAAEREPQRDADRQPHADEVAAGGDDRSPQQTAQGVNDDHRCLLVG